MSLDRSASSIPPVLSVAAGVDAVITRLKATQEHELALMHGYARDYSHACAAWTTSVLAPWISNVDLPMSVDEPAAAASRTAALRPLRGSDIVAEAPSSSESRGESLELGRRSYFADCPDLHLHDSTLLTALCCEHVDTAIAPQVQRMWERVSLDAWRLQLMLVRSRQMLATVPTAQAADMRQRVMDGMQQHVWRLKLTVEAVLRLFRREAAQVAARAHQLLADSSSTHKGPSGNAAPSWRAVILPSPGEPTSGPMPMDASQDPSGGISTRTTQSDSGVRAMELSPSDPAEGGRGRGGQRSSSRRVGVFCVQRWDRLESALTFSHAHLETVLSQLEADWASELAGEKSNASAAAPAGGSVGSSEDSACCPAFPVYGPLCTVVTIDDAVFTVTACIAVATASANTGEMDAAGRQAASGASSATAASPVVAASGMMGCPNVMLVVAGDDPSSAVTGGGGGVKALCPLLERTVHHHFSHGLKGANTSLSPDTTVQLGLQGRLYITDALCSSVHQLIHTPVVPQGVREAVSELSARLEQLWRRAKPAMMIGAPMTASSSPPAAAVDDKAAAKRTATSSDAPATEDVLLIDVFWSSFAAWCANGGAGPGITADEAGSRRGGAMTDEVVDLCQFVQTELAGIAFGHMEELVVTAAVANTADPSRSRRHPFPALGAKHLGMLLDACASIAAKAIVVNVMVAFATRDIALAAAAYPSTDGNKAGSEGACLLPLRLFPGQARPARTASSCVRQILNSVVSIAARVHRGKGNVSDDDDDDDDGTESGGGVAGSSRRSKGSWPLWLVRGVLNYLRMRYTGGGGDTVCKYLRAVLGTTSAVADAADTTNAGGKGKGPRSAHSAAAGSVAVETAFLESLNFLAVHRMLVSRLGHPAVLNPPGTTTTSTAACGGVFLPVGLDVLRPRAEKGTSSTNGATGLPRGAPRAVPRKAVATGGTAASGGAANASATWWESRAVDWDALSWPLDYRPTALDSNLERLANLGGAAEVSSSAGSTACPLQPIDRFVAFQTLSHSLVPLTLIPPSSSLPAAVPDDGDVSARREWTCVRLMRGLAAFSIADRLLSGSGASQMVRTGTTAVVPPGGSLPSVAKATFLSNLHLSYLHLFAALQQAWIPWFHSVTEESRKLRRPLKVSRMSSDDEGRGRVASETHVPPQQYTNRLSDADVGPFLLSATEAVPDVAGRAVAFVVTALSPMTDVPQPQEGSAFRIPGGRTALYLAHTFAIARLSLLREDLIEDIVEQTTRRLSMPTLPVDPHQQMTAAAPSAAAAPFSWEAESSMALFLFVILDVGVHRVKDRNMIVTQLRQNNVSGGPGGPPRKGLPALEWVAHRYLPTLLQSAGRRQNALSAVIPVLRVYEACALAALWCRLPEESLAFVNAGDAFAVSAVGNPLQRDGTCQKTATGVTVARSTGFRPPRCRSGLLSLRPCMTSSLLVITAEMLTGPSRRFVAQRAVSTAEGASLLLLVNNVGGSTGNASPTPPIRRPLERVRRAGVFLSVAPEVRVQRWYRSRQRQRRSEHQTVSAAALLRAALSGFLQRRQLCQVRAVRLLQRVSRGRPPRLQVRRLLLLRIKWAAIGFQCRLACLRAMLQRRRAARLLQRVGRACVCGSGKVVVVRGVDASSCDGRGRRALGQLRSKRILAARMLQRVARGLGPHSPRFFAANFGMAVGPFPGRLFVAQYRALRVLQRVCRSGSARELLSLTHLYLTELQLWMSRVGRGFVVRRGELAKRLRMGRDDRFCAAWSKLQCAGRGFLNRRVFCLRRAAYRRHQASVLVVRVFVGSATRIQLRSRFMSQVIARIVIGYQCRRLARRVQSLTMKLHSESAARFQRWGKGALVRALFTRRLVSIATMHAVSRGYHTRQRLHALRIAMGRLQRTGKGFLGRHMASALGAKCAAVQLLFRVCNGMLQRRLLRQTVHDATAEARCTLRVVVSGYRSRRFLHRLSKVSHSQQLMMRVAAGHRDRLALGRLLAFITQWVSGIVTRAATNVVRDRCDAAGTLIRAASMAYHTRMRLQVYRLHTRLATRIAAIRATRRRINEGLLDAVAREGVARCRTQQDESADRMQLQRECRLSRAAQCVGDAAVMLRGRAGACKDIIAARRRIFSTVVVAADTPPPLPPPPGSGVRMVTAGRPRTLERLPPVARRPVEATPSAPPLDTTMDQRSGRGGGSATPTAVKDRLPSSASGNPIPATSETATTTRTDDADGTSSFMFYRPRRLKPL